MYALIACDKFRQPNESNNEKKITKHVNYFFSSYALLIKRLAIKYLGINERHVGIFVKGEEEDFFISSVVPNNKIVTQITIDEIYETEPLQSELKFIPYQNSLSSSFSANDINLLAKIVICYISIYQNDINYERIHSIFLKAKIIQKALRQLNCTNTKFLDLISNINKKDFADIPYKMHNNHSIVESFHESGYSPTFETIKINENQKLIAGSQAMSAYIIL
ncbi:hypothetical protein M9Y10_003690 [Tritrichomonas musculus]|uniref:Uncharacterized protein n=1 Tax=Tritrichomonas musculus TaxID=1915356 RepID=A0ABR2JRZ6_9EUKA